jgi:hypothetical protein
MFGFDLPNWDRGFVLLDANFPAKLKLTAHWLTIDLKRDGRSEHTFRLKPYASGDAAAWRFPLSAGDLSFAGRGEYITGGPGHASKGVQAYGHDLGARGFDAAGTWSLLRDGDAAGTGACTARLCAPSPTASC